MTHFLNIFYMLWNYKGVRIFLLILLILFIFALVDKAKSKSYTQGYISGVEQMTEQAKKIIDEEFKEEWVVDYTNDNAYMKPVKEDWDYWLRNRKGVYDWNSLSEQEKWDLENEYSLL